MWACWCTCACRKVKRYRIAYRAETGGNEKLNVQKNTKNVMQALRGALLFITAEQNTGLTKLSQRPRELVCMLGEKVTPEN